MPKLDLDTITPERGSDYPPPFAERAAGRLVRNLAMAGGLGDFVANHAVIPPGSWSSQRHWHEGEDELVVVLSGRGILVDDDGPRPIGPGEVAAFPKGDGNAHHIRNESDADLVLLAISLTEASPVHYPDIGMRWAPGGEMEPE